MLSIFSLFLADKPSSHLSQSLLLHSGLSHIYWSLSSISKEKLVSTSLKLSCTLERTLFSTLNLSLTLKVADIYIAIYIPQSASLHYLIQSSDQSNEALKRRKVRLLVIHTLQWPRAEVPACAQPFPHPPLLYYLNLGSDFMIHQALLGSSASQCPMCLKARDNLRHNYGWWTQHNCHSQSETYPTTWEEYTLESLKLMAGRKDGANKLVRLNFQMYANKKHFHHCENPIG